MTLEEILQLIRQGISDKELRPLMKQFVEENPEYRTEVGLLGDEVTQAGLSETQRAQFRQVHGNVMQGQGAIEEETPLMAVGGAALSGAKALVGGTAGRGAVVTGVTKAGEVSTKIVNQNILAKIGQNLVRLALPKGRGGFGYGKVAAGAAAGTMAAGWISGGGERTGEAQAPTSKVQITPSEARGIPLTRGTLAAGQTQLQEPGMQLPRVPNGFNVMVIDHSGDLTGTPGAIAVISPQELDLNPNLNPALVASLANQTDGSVDYLENFNQFLSQNPNALQGNEQRVYQALFPETVGDVQITTATQVGRSLSDIYQPPPRRGTPPSVAGPGQNPEAARVSNPRPTLDQPVAVPAGAEVTPRAFQNYNGRTLVEWASYYARVHGVPLNLLYGIIAHESGWNPNAVGDNGQSHGLAQIYQPTWGNQISVAQSRNPAFALDWTARQLAERFKQYGRWDAAVAAHNSPVAANYLSRTGRFQNEKSARYVNDIMNRANRSGLASDMFDEGMDTEIAGSGPSGPQVSPFEAPDPAASRAYVRGVWQEMLGREPTEEEFAREVERVNALARQSYESQVRAALGGETTQVDVGAQYEESIREMGEFGFHEDVQETRSFTNHTAGIARMLQQGL